MTSDISYISDVSAGDLTPVSDGHGSFEAVQAATGEMVLCSGESMLVYVKSPDSISVGDVGLTVSITVFTSQTMYYEETNVQAHVSTS